MSILQDRPDLQDNLEDLQRSSLHYVALLAGVAIPVWFVWNAWPLAPEPRPIASWIGLGLLLLSVSLCYALLGHHLNVAMHVLVWGILGASVCAVLTFPAPELVYLFVLPVIFGSVLLGQWFFFLVSLLAILLTLNIGSYFAGAPPSGSTVLAAVMIGVTTLSLWLSRRNLHTALAWVWSGYERARHNEEIARERAGDLQRALKALDEATHRLERTNYMLALARDQAEEARRLKQQFAQTISHELRTPLNLIVGFSELMTQSPEHYGGQLPPPYLRDLTIVYRNARHLQNLVNDVLDLACIEAVQMSLLPEEIAPETLVREAVNTARGLVEARGLTLHAETEAGLPSLWMDPVRIRQVLFNLLSNAARFTSEGSVTVSVCRQGEDVVFAVADTGAGIAPGDIERIFEEFQQADGSTRRRHGGAGLGLAISRRFVQLHGGHIWAESRMGEGSTFYFSLPVCRSDAITVVGSAQTPSARHVSARGSEAPVLLAVTASPSTAGLLTRYVHGCRTLVVPNLQQARQAAQHLMPQAVVIDQSCEALEAAQLAHAAQDWSLPDTSFMSCPLPGEASLRQHLNVDGFLIKPVSRQVLWDVLRQFGKNIDRVLVIDDDDDFVRLLTRMLESAVRHYQVVSAYSGQEGLTMMQRRQPDLVLLDLVLPDMHGSELIERIRAVPEWKDVPVVVISGQDEMDVQKPLGGCVTLAKGTGLMPAEVVRLIQHVVDASVTSLPNSAGSRGAPVP